MNMKRRKRWWRREYGPAMAGAVTLVATVGYLAVIQSFELRLLLTTAFVVVTVGIFVYWTCGEPRASEGAASDDSRSTLGGRRDPVQTSHRSR